jgi:hypothetical protein
MDPQVSEVVGPKDTHDPDRAAVRHGHEDGSLTLGGRRMPVRRPSYRSAVCSEMRARICPNEHDYWWSRPPAGSWAEAHQGSLYLKFEAENSRAPVLVAGMWNEGEQAEAVRGDAAVVQASRTRDIGSGTTAPVITRSSTSPPRCR